ncbi:3-dehydro-L-gulonate 2-dehydrogenase [Terriglobus tenax]|uniref:3-dehydro-L-gulonate 2-dehydrogenase n=1 Tax=Terriglobus tenax TaxID=1111115 RepID=UPI0021E0EEE7|nr:3-dehydro-L-gulonate 2-dehydrogenase [Terriglobus tenax]
MLRIPYDELVRTLVLAHRNLGYAPARAQESATLFAETTRDGVYTHGIARFPRLAKLVGNGCVKPEASPTFVSGFGALERWDGNYGPGNLNAWHSMGRAIALAAQHGIGCVAVRHTNHWMRAGTYGLQAAESGMMGLCFTNTMPNMAPWGGKQPVLGNNPLVIAVPRTNGAHFLVDLAMSQFSYGALDGYAARGEQLPVPGGFDKEGNISSDPKAILEARHPMPIGYWKGSALSMMLDVVAATLSFGQATCQIDEDPLKEAGVSQVFVAINPSALGDVSRIGDQIIASLHTESGSKARYPGEKLPAIRGENMEKGVPVDENIWEETRKIAGLA